MALALMDLIDRAVLVELAENLWRSSGLPTKVVDPQGRVLVSSGSQDLCFFFHRRHPIILQSCVQSDIEIDALLQTQTESGPSLETRCRSGLSHIGMPIVIAGQHLATLFLSQFFYDPPDEETYRQRAREFGFAEEEYLAALRQVPVLDRGRVQEAVAYYRILVRLLDEMGTREAQLLASRETLRLSEEKFRTLFQGANDALFIVDPSGRILDVNETTCTRLGYSEGEFRRMHVKDIDTTEFAKVADAQVRCILEEGVAVFETVHVGKDGRQVPVEISARKIEIEGRPAILAIARDLTERKKREEELLYRERFEGLIAGISTRFMQVEPAGLDGAIESALRELIEFAGVDRAYLFCLSEDGRRMSNTHEACSAGIPCEREHLQELPVSDLPWIMNRLMAGNSVHIPRVADLPPEAVREKNHLSAQGIHSLLSFPVLAERKLIGVVGFDAVRAEMVWEERDIKLLSTFANLLGSALERRRANEALEYRARLEHLIATLSTQMVNLDADSIDPAIEAALAELGTFVNVDRCYVFQFSADRQLMSNTHEWCAPGIPPARGNLQGAPSSSFPWFLEELFRHQFVHIPAVEELGPEAAAEKAEFERQKIRSMLCVPMLIEEHLLGFIGFDSVRQHKDWPDDLKLLLRLAGEFFANALERRRRDRELQENQERIAAILRSLRAGLMGVDQEGRIILLNRPAAAILTLAADSSYGKLLSTLPIEPVLQRQISAVLAGRKVGPVEWTVAFGEDRTRTVEARTDPIRGSEKRLRCKGAITMLRDVSAEREIDHMKSEFISTAAHELRTPLASVLGYAELLLNPETFGTFSAEEQREFLEEIVNKAEALANLVNDLLDLSRIESGQLVRLMVAPARPDLLIEGVVEDFRRRISDRRFELNLATLPEMPLDAAKFRQVMENLLGNAVKFSPANSCIRVQAALRGNCIEVQVTDEGVGMSPEVLAHIFDKFYRGDAHSSVAGLGLGMTIVKNIVEAHGGEIRVKSTQGGGTRVAFTLPWSGDHGP